MEQTPAFHALEILFSTVLSLAGFGVPLSMPPAEEDPFLARIAPAQCVYYTRLAGTAEPKAASDNHIDQLFREPQVQRFVQELDDHVRQLAQLIEQQQGPDSHLFSAISRIARLLASQPAAFYITDFQFEPLHARGGLLIRLDNRQQEAEQALHQLGISSLGEVISKFEIQGTEFSVASPSPKAPPIAWGVHRGYLIVGMGKDEIKGILRRSQTAAPVWLEERLQRFMLPRRATFTYANLEAILHQTLEFVDDEDLLLFSQALGLQHLKSYVSITGLDATRFVSRTQIDIERPATGLINAVFAKPFSHDELGAIPSDALIATAVGLDTRELFRAVVEFLDELEPANAQAIRGVVDHFEQATGIEVEQELLESLGDVLRIYTTPREGGLISGWIVSFSLDDGEQLKAAERQMVDSWVSDLKRSEFLDHTLYSAAIAPGVPLLPTWCVTDDELVIGLFPQAVRSHLESAHSLGSIAQIKEVKQAVEPGPTMLAYYDTAALVRTVYPFVQVAGQAYASMLARSGLKVDISILPSATALSRHVRPGVLTAEANPEGFLIQTHQSLPGGSLGTTAPMAAAALLPAVNAARVAGRRNQSLNNLRQIVLAAINYESTHGHYPAAFNIDENGEPLLSWRVHILPFLGEEALYTQFRLDEPWNSEHNRKLIPLMPQVYRAPNSHADPGKTVYVAVRGPDGVIIPPTKDQRGVTNPRGVAIRSILDGTSKTIVAVEASDDLAVIWTKPDDFEPDNDRPIKGLVGPRRNEFIAGFCDGHVRLIHQTVATETLRALFTRSGGEVVRGF